ncbi:MAG TPA: Spy/CpxP family protein refolding chaperone [Gammaproteobacteria bacterium]
MKANRILMTVTLAGLLAAGSTAALACGGQGGKFGPDGVGPMRAIYQLDNLSDAQRKQLDALRDKQRKEMEQTRDERRALHEQMDKATDAKTLRPLAEQQGKQVTEMIMKRQEMRNEVEKILTPEQRSQLKEMETKWRDGKDEDRERGQRW